MGFSFSDIPSYGASAATLGLVSPDAVRTAFGGAKEDPRLLEQQKALNAQLQAAALGQTPSAAETQFKTSADQLVAQQYALANSSPGVAPAAALRQAQVGAAGIGQGLAGQQAALRAQEQERARQLYAQMLASQREAAGQHQARNAAALGGTLGGIGSAATAGG